LAFALALGANPGFAVEHPSAAVEVPHADDLRADARIARQNSLPILLVFASDTCSYCAQLEEDYLKPMLHTGEYTDKILIRKLLIRDTRTLTDFDGGTVEASELARRYQVDLVPTIVFVDSQGRELAERMVGLGTVDFYWGYLKAALDTAIAGMRASAN
jgi:thioredoxin-related protein